MDWTKVACGLRAGCIACAKVAHRVAIVRSNRCRERAHHCFAYAGGKGSCQCAKGGPSEGVCVAQVDDEEQKYDEGTKAFIDLQHGTSPTFRGLYTAIRTLGCTVEIHRCKTP